MKSKKREYLSSATLIILGNNFDPKYISRLLDLKPDQMWMRDEVKMIGEKLKHVYKDSGWKKYISKKYLNKYLEPQLEYWCKLLIAKSKAIKKLSKDGNRIVLNCFIGTDSTATININSELLEKLAALKIGIEFDIFK